MAEKGESLAAAAGEETELKEKLQRVVKILLDEDDYGIEITTEAIGILSCLADLKLKKSVGMDDEDNDDTVLPEKFKCPISDEMMADPVILSSGQVRLLKLDSFFNFVFVCLNCLGFG